jgi:hypothetical protein
MGWFHRTDGDETWHKLLKGHEPAGAVPEDSSDLISTKPAQPTPNDVEGRLIKFDYCDADGKETTRTVNCYRVWHGDGCTYVQGWCMLRNELRTFRTERMSNLLEVRTAKRISDPVGYFDNFADDEPPPRDRTPGVTVTAIVRVPSRQEIEARAFKWHQRHQARRVCIDGLRVLAYVALAGDGWTDGDRNIEESYIEARLAVAGFKQSQELTNAMMDIGAGLAVPFSSFIHSANFAAADESHFALVRDSVEEMIAADGGSSAAQNEAYHRLMAAGLAPHHGR